MIFLYVGLAGFLGAITRVWVGKELISLFPYNGFPFPTLFINLLGSFILAFFLMADLKKLSPKMKTAISTGFLGAFTTFSTFSVETLALLQQGSYLMAFLYILTSFIGGFLFSWLGMTAAWKLAERNLATNIRGSES